MSKRLDDGFSTIIALASGAIKFWEKQVTPPGMDGGGENDTTTMRNTRYRTRAPKKLVTMTDMTLVAAYDPAVYPQIVTNIQVNQQITVTFSDGSTLVFWGWLDKFVPGEIQEGTQPTATVTIVPSNQDNSSPPVEQAPVLTPS